MEDKLKNLDKIMEKAVYQKKRFSEEKKQNIMKRIREQRKPSFIETYMWMVKPALSISVCIFLLIFSISFILQPPQQKDRSEGDLLQQVDIGREVTSLPLLNRVSHIAKEENKTIEYVSVSKNEKYVLLNINVVPNASKSDIKETVEKMFYKGSELYQHKEELNKIGAPWNDYTVDITIVEKFDHKGIYDGTQTQQTLLRGVKSTNQDHITWMEE
ncbi:hypothetical protein [Alkalihalobacillus sp. TS-13]|uniref:hypothetical protein n=1 Tax=Alkalihalobacillus sp. TS-13 TaxID=2842455 RepID=UPI001C87C00C|nr:hypothetical protein [Alkalihalobacillus sp. TS-13]